MSPPLVLLGAASLIVIALLAGTVWKDADADIPIFKQAKAEYTNHTPRPVSQYSLATILLKLRLRLWHATVGMRLSACDLRHSDRQ